MFTPQQIDQVSFGRSTFGGYDMQQVDEFLEPLTEDYVTLYKENALLKSKMRVLVGKLEEYRKQESTMQNTVQAARQQADKLLSDARAQAEQEGKRILAQANRDAVSLVESAMDKLADRQTGQAYDTFLAAAGEESRHEQHA